MKRLFLTAAISLLFVSFCSSQTAKENAIREIIAAENAFSKMAAEKGIHEAFVFFAADDATIKRGNDTLIHGKDGIGNFYSKEVFKKAKLEWAPDFTDASENGDMGYTYGKYHWLLKDGDKVIDESHGVFHTVWKKQKDGLWKFVWD